MIAAPEHLWSPRVVSRNPGAAVGSIAAAADATDASAILGRCPAVRSVLQQLRQVAATDSTVLLLGASGPQPHPNFIEVFCQATVDDGYREVAGTGEDGAAGPAGKGKTAVISAGRLPRTGAEGGGPMGSSTGLEPEAPGVAAVVSRAQLAVLYCAGEAPLRCPW